MSEQQLTNGQTQSLQPSQSSQPSEEATKLIERLETYYDFESTGGPLRLCLEWQELTEHVRALHAQLLTVERERDEWREVAEFERSEANKYHDLFEAAESQLEAFKQDARDKGRDTEKRNEELIAAYWLAQENWSAQCFCFTSAPESLRRNAHEAARDGFNEMVGKLGPIVRPMLNAEYWEAQRLAKAALASPAVPATTPGEAPAEPKIGD